MMKCENRINFVDKIKEVPVEPGTKQAVPFVTRLNTQSNTRTPAQVGNQQASMTDDRCLPDFNGLAEQLAALGAQSVFIVADAGAFQYSGVKEKLLPSLKRFHITLFSDFVPNPQLPDVLAGLKLFRESRAAAVIAVGGGTAIDIAKLIAAFSNESSPPRELIQKQASFNVPSVPLIAIPTTAGTGSEATQFAVVYMDGIKYSVDHPKLMPSYCVLDEELTQNLPPRVTAQTGLDAFCQGVESIWSVRATEASIRDATQAVRLAYAHLRQAVHSPSLTSRAGMLRASHLAGRAINQTRTTAPHAISYSMTSGFGVPHGHAVALTLGPMLVYNSQVTEKDANDSRGVAYTQQQIQHILGILNCNTPEEGQATIRNFVESLGCETSLKELRIQGLETLHAIAAKVNVERLNNNPRRLSTDEIFRILQSIEQKVAS